MNLVVQTIVYIIIKVFDKKSDWISFYFLFSVLGSCHLYRYFNDFYGWRVDGAISIMMMLCKMTYITFYYCDGRLKKIPTTLEYYSYLNFYPSASVGPVYDL